MQCSCTEKSRFSSEYRSDLLKRFSAWRGVVRRRTMVSVQVRPFFVYKVYLDASAYTDPGADADVHGILGKVWPGGVDRMEELRLSRYPQYFYNRHCQPSELCLA